VQFEQYMQAWVTWQHNSKSRQGCSQNFCSGGFDLLLPFPFFLTFPFFLLILFLAHKNVGRGLNPLPLLKYSFESRGLQVICKQSEQKKIGAVVCRTVACYAMHF